VPYATDNLAKTPSKARYLEHAVCLRSTPLCNHPVSQNLKDYKSFTFLITRVFTI